MLHIFGTSAKKKEVMFNRKIIEELKVWKEKADRKPLMMLGARQVGKTSSVFSIKSSLHRIF